MTTVTRDKPLAAAELRARRPLSPHLQIFRPMLTMLMSIAHRITGAALYFGMAGLAAWLLAVASGPQAYDAIMGALASLPGRIVMVAFSWALIHHLLGGVRHLIWDTGAGFDLTSVERLAQATIIGSVLLTALLWLAVWWLGGL